MAINPVSFPTPQAFSGGVDFSPLANLGNVAREAQKQQSLANLGQQLASGNIDYRQAAGQIAGLGDIKSTLGFLELAEAERQRKAGEVSAANFSRLIGGPPAAAPSVAPPTAAPPTAGTPAVSPKVTAPVVPPTEADMAAAPAATPEGGVPAVPPGAPVMAQGKETTQAERLTDPGMIPRYLSALTDPNLPKNQKEVATELLKRAFDNAKPTEKIQTLSALRDDPQLLELEKELRRASAPSVTVTGEKAQAAEVGKEVFGKLQENALKAGVNAPKRLGTLDIMERALNDPNFYSGSGGQAMTAFKRGLVALGMDDAATAAPNEVFDKMSKQVVTEVLSGEKGGAGLGSGVSNADRDFITGIVPGLQNTPEGNRTLIEIQRRLVQRDREIARMTRDYARAHNGLIDYDHLANIDDYQEKHPLFADLKMQFEKAGTSGGAPAVSGPAKIGTKADYDALKPGTSYTDPEGNVRTKR
jgi:hypothetical protein